MTPRHIIERLHAQIYSALFLVGALFLLATLVVHALLPELRRSVRGLSLMAHCACMFVAHISLTIVQLEGSIIADAASYIIQYSLLAGFFWMNVMCIDIAFTFRSLQSMAYGGSAEYRKFLLYTLYAMGAPFLIFLVTLWADASSIIPAAVKPDIGVKYCWFDKCEFTLFMLFLKLFGLMGIPWIMEIISWAVGGKDYYWYLTDAINLLRSVFIFIMFCCKRKVWLMLTKRHPRMTARISTRLSRGTTTTSHGDDGSTATQRSSIDLPTSAISVPSNHNWIRFVPDFLSEVRSEISPYDLLSEVR
ncbi:hypothetical protein B566_EDAN007320 [Ephemera danica]|nr:hypothetical protein B566_EDAN007320 [Ephemera danica]